MRHYDHQCEAEGASLTVLDEMPIRSEARSSHPEDPVALFVIGPGAVGKHAVGHRIAELLGKRWAFCPNHQMIEISYGMYPTAGKDAEVDWEFVEKMRQAADAYLVGKGDSVVKTNVVHFNRLADRMYFTRQAQDFAECGYRVCVAYLCAPFAERIRRNKMMDRLEAKPSKQDIARSERFLRQEAEQGVLDYPSIEDVERVFGGAAEAICIVDTAGSSVDDEAREIIYQLSLDNQQRQISL